MSRVVLSFLVLFVAVVIVFNVSDHWLVDFIYRLQGFQQQDLLSYVRTRLSLQAVDFSGNFGADLLSTLRFIGQLLVTPFQAVYFALEWLFVLLSNIFAFFPINR